MTVWILGDEDGKRARQIGRYIQTDVLSGVPSGSGPHVVVVNQVACPERIVRNSSVELLVLVEPGIEERDRVTRMLAAVERPRLEIIEHVAESVQAERTWALLLTIASGIHESAAALRSMHATESHLVVGPAEGGSWLEAGTQVSLYGRTLGFIGFGPIAWLMSHWAAGHDMNVVFWPEPVARSVAVEIEAAALRSGARQAAFDEVLSAADVLVLDVAYGADSIRLIDSPELALMPSDVLLVNASHGRAIDEGALLQSLRDGRLGGVALDRFNYEPIPHDSPLLEFERLLLTPGIAVPMEAEVSDATARRVATAVGSWDPTAGVRKVRHLRRRPSRR